MENSTSQQKRCFMAFITRTICIQDLPNSAVPVDFFLLLPLGEYVAFIKFITTR